MSQAVQFRDNAPLTFFKQKNKRWPLDDINRVTVGNLVIKNTDVVDDSVVANYQDTITINTGTAEEKTIIKQRIPAIDSDNKKPTITDGKVTTQPGNIIFDKQQELVLAGKTIKIAGYGKNNILNSYGYDVVFSDLSIELEPMTTTTTSTVTDSTTVPVDSVGGVLPSVTTVSGIGIDASTVDPTVESRSVTSGAGNLILSSAQTLENETVLTYSNSGKKATITGNVEIIKAGTTSETIYFDVESLLSMS